MTSGASSPNPKTTPSLSRPETRHRKNQSNRVTRYQGRAEAREATR